MSELKDGTSSGKLPFGALGLGNSVGSRSFEDVRKLDIENERLPPSLTDEIMDEPEEDELEGLRRRGSGKRPTQGLVRRPSQGTTRTTSPSNRRRSVESTMAHIKETLDGGAEDKEVTKIAEQLSRVWVTPNSSRPRPV